MLGWTAQIARGGAAKLGIAVRFAEEGSAWWGLPAGWHPVHWVSGLSLGSSHTLAAADAQARAEFHSRLVRGLHIAMNMMVREIWDLMAVGAMLAVALRWLLNLDIKLLWAGCIGAVSALLQPWVTLDFGLFVSPHLLPDIVLGGAVAAALFAVAQVIGDH